MVDWQALASEVGRDMANNIFDLSSEDLEVRKQALEDLFEICWHQGTVYERSYIAIPFLIKRLENETDIDLLEELIRRIYPIGTGTSYHDVHQTLIINRERKETPEYQAKIAEELEWVDAVTREFNKGIEVYLKLLARESSNIRFEAVCCISSCFVKYTICQLYEHFANETDNDIKSIIPLCLAFFSDKEIISLTFLEQILDTENSEIVKLSASIALAYIRKKN